MNPSGGGREAALARGRAAVALDFDGTLTVGGKPLKQELIGTLLELKEGGTKVLLATGRCVRDVDELAGDGLFDGVVAENGAVISFGGARRSMAPEGWGGVRARLLPFFEPGCEDVIISAPVEALESARMVVPADLAQIELNKDRLMIMPRGVNKGTGLAALLASLHLSGEETTCVGDGENDLPMFEVSGVKVALANSVESLKSIADFVSEKSDGEGTIEALDRLFPRHHAPSGVGEP